MALADLATPSRATIDPASIADPVVAHYSLPAFDDGDGPELVPPAAIGSQKLAIPDNAVLVSRLNPHTPRVWMPDDGSLVLRVASTEFAVLVPKPEVDRRYLYCVCSSPAFVAAMLGFRTGTTGSHQRVRPDDLMSIEVPLPPVEEQRAIGAVLGALDDRITSNRRLVERSVACVRLECRRASIEAPSVPYSNTVRVEFGIPHLGEYFTTAGQGRPLLRIRDIATGSPQVWTTERRTDEILVDPGDIVVGMDAQFSAALWLGPVSLLNQRVCRITPLAGVSRAFALTALEPELAQAERSKSGTTVIHLNKADIDRFVVPGLSAAAHQRLGERADPMIDRALAANAERVTLYLLKELLSAELLAGRRRVPEAA